MESTVDAQTHPGKEIRSANLLTTSGFDVFSVPIWPPDVYRGVFFLYAPGYAPLIRFSFF